MRARALQRGELVPRSGEGVLLLRSSRACSYLFGERAVTLTDRRGVVSPSSIVVNADRTPVSEGAVIDEGAFLTDDFSVTLGEATKLTLLSGEPPEARSCLVSITPFITAKRMSISTALLLRLGLVEAPEGLEGWMARRQADLLGGRSDMLELVHGMLGLGYGLTPSGDDFTVGVILASEVMGHGVERLREVVERYENVFSRTALLDALGGHYALPVKRLGDAMLGTGGIRSAARCLTTFGNTSGTDILAGVWFVMSRLDRGEALS
jgi:hypothetical protein